jgi:hypothetical protein
MRLVATILLVVAAAMAAFLFLFPIALGVGFRDQQVTVKTAKPVKSISYYFSNVDGELRPLTDDTPDHPLFDWTVIHEPIGERFTATVMITTRSGRLIKTTVNHPRHLVILAEFTDGTRACRVIDVPNGLSEQPVTADFD